MPPQHTDHNTWYQTIHDYTRRLVAMRSVSPGRDEVQVAHEILRMLHEDGLATRYTASGLDDIESDPFGRQNAYAFLQGQSATSIPSIPPTIVPLNPGLSIRQDSRRDWMH